MASVSLDLTRGQTLQAVLASIDVTAADEPAPVGAHEALRWALLVWGEGHDHVPLFLIHDLGHVLTRGRDLRFTSSKQMAHWGDEERAIRLAYEDRLVARWATDPTIIEAHVAVAGVPEALRDRAVAHAVAMALAPPLVALGLPRTNPAHLRTLLESGDLHPLLTSAETVRAHVEGVWRTVTLDTITRCQAALVGKKLLEEADLWDIAHLQDVPSESARRALREVHAASARVGPADPSALLTLRRAKEIPLDRQHADAYPTGGFDAVSTKGSFENLVRSEVAYVGAGIDDGPPKPGERAVDLFDVRFAEGELLYYTRDESPLLEERRVLTLVVDRVAELRHKLPELSAQTLVLVLGVCTRLQSDLVNGLGAQGSFVTLALCHAPGDGAQAAVVKEELALVALSLRAEVAHRRVQLVRATAPLEVEGRKRVIFSPRPPPLPLPPTVRAWIRVGGRVWTMTTSMSAGERTFDAADAQALRALADAILAST